MKDYPEIIDLITQDLDWKKIVIEVAKSKPYTFLRAVGNAGYNTSSVLQDMKVDIYDKHEGRFL